MTGKQTQDKCRICHKTMHPYDLGEKNDYQLIACRACGSVMTDPWPTPDDREKFFGDIQPVITHVPHPDKEIADLEKILLKLTQKNAEGKTFIDVNCRNGYAVEAAKNINMQAYGIDQHEFFIDFAQKKYDPKLFENTTVQEHAEKGKKYDIVFAREAFCEQTDLENYVENLGRLIAPGGLLYVEEPDGNNFNVPKNFTSWNIVFPPMNFVYISKKGFRSILARHNLRIEKIFFNWRPIMRMIIRKN